MSISSLHVGLVRCCYLGVLGVIGRPCSVRTLVTQSPPAVTPGTPGWGTAQRRLEDSRCRDSRAPLGVDSLSHLGLDDVPDQTPRAFHEGEFVRQAAFKQHTHAIVAAHVGGRDERDILCHAQVHQVEGLGQDEEVPCRRGLYFSEFLAEVLNKHVVQASAEFHRLLAEKLEALIYPGKKVAGYEHPCLQGFLDV